MVLATVTAALLLVPVTQAAAATLEVNLAGEGTGHVQATLLHENEESFGEINCSNVPGHTPAEDVCSATVEAGDRSSDLKATGGPLSVFTGWETTGLFGGCKGLTNPCSFIVLFGDATVTANFGAEELAPKVEFPAVAPPPLEPVQGITDSEAELHGRVNPESDLLKACRFEYLTQAAYEKDGNSFKTAKQLSCAPAPAGIGEGTSFVEVQANATGLEPNTEYRVRLLAEKEKSEPKAVTGETTFTTTATAPTLSDSKAWSISDTTATLAAVVNPRNSEITDCHFEYVTQVQFDADGFASAASVPCAPAPGSGNSDVVVSADVSTLAISTAYRFHLVADNAIGGPQVGEDATFVTRAPVVFPSRGFELVSAFNNNGVPAFPDLAAANGNRYGYSSGALPLPGAEGPVANRFVATRLADGSWTQQYVGPPHPDSGSGYGQPFPRPAFSPDLSYTAWGVTTGIDPDDQNNPGDDGDKGQDFYMRKLSDGGFTWLSRDPRIPVGTSQTDPTNVSNDVSTPFLTSPSISADGSRILFTSRRNLLDADISNGSDGALYEWRDGVLSLLSIRPDISTGFAEDVAIGSFGHEQPFVYGNAISRNAVSPDGRRVAFQVGGLFANELTPLDFWRLYVRIDGESTVEASAPATGAPAVGPPKQVSYGGADRETRSIFFTSSSPLTPDSTAPDIAGAPNAPAPADLYRYTVPPDGDPANGKLVDLTPHPGGAGVNKVLSVSDDGTRVYFLSAAALTPAAKPAPQCSQLVPTSWKGLTSLPQAGRCNVYLAQLDDSIDVTPQFTLIASGQVILGRTTGVGGGTEKMRPVSSDPGGSVLAFTSAERLVPGRQTGDAYQVYVYEAKRDALSCASCPPDGSVPAAFGDLTPGGADLLQLFAATNEEVPHIRNVSSDGAVFFQTSVALLPTDTTAGVSVYEWRGGRLRLITSGDDLGDAYFADATEGDSTARGATVFFQSADAYVPGVPGGVPRIYAARVGGGFTPPLPNPPCTGEDCKPVATSQPDYAAPSTSTIDGRGNQAQARKKCRGGRVRRKGRCVVRRQQRTKPTRRRAGAGRRAAR